ncbi:MAG: class I SAM-dependent methyltransferase, partial [Bacteroidota bacterium]
RVFYLLYPFRKFFLFLYNFSNLTACTSENRKNFSYNDFFRPSRKYDDRIKGFQHVLETCDPAGEVPVTYMEFGVASGASFRWWLSNLKHKDSTFYGFDTFEGLPENWGLFFKKGDMSHQVAEINDSRHQFIKGLFQETLGSFIKENAAELNSEKRKIVHLDADLFTATLFVLTQLAPYFHKGDILIFDEFSVPDHEFFALDIFQKSYYVKLKPLTAINNFYQCTFIIE